ncbi:MAG: nuclear transport factor 2 family protein [Rhizomicrobium sp.]
MRKMIAALFAASLLVASPALASAKGEVEAAVRQLIRYANAGNDAAFAGMLAPGGIVIDEFAPFRWNGLDAWAAAYGAYNQQNGVTNARTAILGIKHVHVEGDRAYAVVRVVYSYKQNGVPRTEKGSDVFVLAKTPAGWRALGFAWAGAGGIDAGADAAAVAETVRAELESFNAGTTDFTKLPWNGVIDEFPPYAFAGATTVADWGAGFAKTGQTDTKIALAAPIHLSVNGAEAYIVVPATITGKIKGKPLREHGSFAFTLSKTAAGWQTRSWAWALD